MSTLKGRIKTGLLIAAFAAAVLGGDLKHRAPSLLPLLGVVNLTSTFTLTTGIVPGPGWSGATSNPAQQGDSGDTSYAYYPSHTWGHAWTDAGQLETGSFYLSVFAFHGSGMQKVRFQVDAGKFRDVTSPSAHPVTGLTCYWVLVKASDCADGVHTARYIAYPTNGKPVVGADCYFATNAGGTATPTRTVCYVSSTGSFGNTGVDSSHPVNTIARAVDVLAAANSGSVNFCTIYLMDSIEFNGTDSSGITSVGHGVVTIRPAPGLTKANITLVCGDFSHYITKLKCKLYDLTLQPEDYFFFYRTSTGNGETIWADNCILQRGTSAAVGVADNGTYGQDGTAEWFITDNRYYISSEVRYCRTGPSNAWLVMLCNCHDIGEDTFKAAHHTIGNTATNINPLNYNGKIDGTHEIHPDLWEGWYDYTVHAYNVCSGTLNTQGISMAAVPYLGVCYAYNTISGTSGTCIEFGNVHVNTLFVGGSYTGLCIFRDQDLTISCTNCRWQGAHAPSNLITYGHDTPVYEHSTSNNAFPGWSYT